MQKCFYLPLANLQPFNYMEQSQKTIEFLLKLADKGLLNPDYGWRKVVYVNAITKVIVIDLINNTEHLIEPSKLLVGSSCCKRNLLNATPIKPKGFWNKQNILNAVYQCESYSEFRTKYEYTAYFHLCKNLPLLINYIKEYYIVKNPNNGIKVAHNLKWTLEACKKDALNYDTRKDFQIGSPGAYSRAWEQGWLNYVCSHMTIQGNRFNKFVYMVTFPDSALYIGITDHYKTRWYAHLNNKRGSIYKYIKKSNSTPDFKLITKIPILVDDAVKMEIDLISYYKETGHKVLNKNRGGGIGSVPSKWQDKNTCQLEANKYKNTTDFYKGSYNCYMRSIQYGYFDDITKNLTRLYNPSGYWTKEKCHREALKYSGRKAYQLGSPAAYSKAMKNKWLNDICSHMIRPVNHNKKWTSDAIYKILDKYNYYSEFIKNEISAQSILCSNKRIMNTKLAKEFYAKKTPNGDILFKQDYYRKWKEDKITEVANLCESKIQFKKEYGGAYRASIALGIHDKVCSHMIKAVNHNDSSNTEPVLYELSEPIEFPIAI